MSKQKCFILAAFLLLSCTQLEEPQVPPIPHYYEPWEDMPELFHYVQTDRVFADGKTFVDYMAKEAPILIEEQFDSLAGEGDIDIEAFLKLHFEAPPLFASPAPVDTLQSMQEHLEGFWEQLVRQPTADDGLHSTLIHLPGPYVVPGGRFREIYYWDSYFTMQGLAVSGREDLLIAMLDNFAWLIDEEGYIPNGNRSYYLGRSQPPFFAGMIELLEASNPAAAAKYLPQLAKEHAFWMDGAQELSPAAPEHRRVVMLGEGMVLNRYYDDKTGPRPESYREDIALAGDLPGKEERNALYRNLRAACESGWDFSSRWLADPDDLASIRTTRIIPVDLNCLLYRMELLLSHLYEGRGEVQLANRFASIAEFRKEAILTYCWDSRRAIFSDYDIDSQRPTGKLTAAGMLPLYLGIADQAKADAMIKQVLEQLRFAGGIASTTVASGQQWDYPNGWAPQQWMAIEGLARYGHEKEAQAIAHDWLRLNDKVFRQSGKMMEKYNVADLHAKDGGGEYPTQDGFGWTNGVALALIERYGMPAAETENE